jgi:peptidoglycan hydrolase-like protein with peptidoglycan-binding domain
LNEHDARDTTHDTRQRLQRVDVRVSPQENARIKASARKAGLNVSAYIRRRALGGGNTKGPEVDAATLAKALADLKHAGSNVNQIARVLNTYGAQSIPAPAVKSALAKLADAAGLVSAALSIVRNQ